MTFFESYTTGFTSSGFIGIGLSVPAILFLLSSVISRCIEKKSLSHILHMLGWIFTLVFFVFQAFMASVFLKDSFSPCSYGALVFFLTIEGALLLLSASSLFTVIYLLVSIFLRDVLYNRITLITMIVFLISLIIAIEVIRYPLRQMVIDGGCYASGIQPNGTRGTEPAGSKKSSESESDE